MRRALLIGINNYPAGSELHGCIEDINALASVLERNEDNSKNFDIMLLPDLQCSEDAKGYIEQLFHDDADIALFYFSGHGYVDANGGQLVFPKDVDIATVNKDYSKLGIKMDYLMDIANHSKAKHKVLILDCCHSGLLGANDVDAVTSVLASGVSILTACRDDESAVEMGGHGIFTELLTTALSGEAADFSGNITMGGIYAYIDRSLGAWDQRPIFKTNVSEFVAIRNVTPRVPNETIHQLTALFETQDKEYALDPSYEDTNSPTVEHKYIEPYANAENIKKFKCLQELQKIGFIEPVGAPFMYFAAMESKSCRLTPIGKYYWRLVKNNRI